MTDMFIGIDPGASGGIAGICRTKLGNIIRVLKPFKNTEEANNNIKECLKYEPTTVTACIENVHAFPTDARSRAFAFGTNFGIWLGMLTAFSISHNRVTPSTWQSHFGSFPKEKKHRKNAIKDIAKERFPNTDKITLATADAILIALYAKEEKC